MKQPRLRVFAGANGSGKSTLNSVIDKKLLGQYINADDMEKSIKEIGYLDFSLYQITVLENDLFAFLNNHTLIEKANLQNEVKKLSVKNNKLFFTDISLNSYYTSVCADYIRHKLLENKISFTFETVMSFPDKIDFLEKAKKSGYRVYLYYISTQDPIINISRVENRVKNGGHNVPKDKIESRYYRSLKLLSSAVKHTDRAYIFDNSVGTSINDRVWILEITDAKRIKFKTDTLPLWINEYLIDIKEKVMTKVY